MQYAVCLGLLTIGYIISSAFLRGYPGIAYCAGFVVGIVFMCARIIKDAVSE